MNRVIPKHVGIIMDGNGRWAAAQGKPRVFGHKAGVARLCEVVETANEVGLESISFYAFSTENWKRPKSEVDSIIAILRAYVQSEIARLEREGSRFVVLGDVNGFPRTTCQLLKSAMERTKNNKGLTINLALNYGSHAELVRAAKSIAEDVQSGALDIEAISADTIESRLYTQGQPMLDLVIRTSGEQRLSNFMLWQAAYAEFLFVEEHWPDFGRESFLKAMDKFANRNRRFGGL